MFHSAAVKIVPKFLNVKLAVPRVKHMAVTLGRNSLIVLFTVSVSALLF